MDLVEFHEITSVPLGGPNHSYHTMNIWHSLEGLQLAFQVNTLLLEPGESRFHRPGDRGGVFLA